MLKKNAIVTLSDNRDYYIVDEIILDEVKYYYLATTDGEKIDVMFVRSILNYGASSILIVRDKNIIKSLTQILINRNN